MPTEIIDDVYDITWQEGGGRRFRSFLIDGEVPTLVDTCLEDATDTLLEGIQEVGVEPERLLVTHSDPDHVQAYDTVVGEFDPETWVPEQTELAADNHFGDGDTVGQFEAIHVPGHAEDSYVLVDEAEGFAVIGDALMGADLRGLPAGYLTLPPEVYSNDLNAADQNLEKLLGYEFDAALVFHGSSVLENASEKLDTYVEFPGKP